MCALCVSHVHVLVFTAIAHSRVTHSRSLALCLPHFFTSVWWRWCWCVHFIQFISVLSSLNRILIHFCRTDKESEGERQRRERDTESAKRNRYLFTRKSHKPKFDSFFFSTWHRRVFLSFRFGFNSITNLRICNLQRKTKKYTHTIDDCDTVIDIAIAAVAAIHNDGHR